MLKNKSFYLSLIIVMSVIVVGMIAVEKNQPANAQTDIATQREAEVRKWQEKVNAWNAAALSKAQNTNLSGQGIQKLPNTGPSEQ